MPNYRHNVEAKKVFFAVDACCVSYFTIGKFSQLSYKFDIGNSIKQKLFLIVNSQSTWTAAFLLLEYSSFTSSSTMHE